MGGSALSRIYFFAAIIGVFFALIGFYWAFQSSIQQDITVAQNKISGKDLLPTGPSISIEKLGDGSVRIYWENLPEGSKKVEVFRTLLKKKGWEKWKIIELPANSSSNGSMDFALEDGENADDFQFYIQAINDAGSVVWTGPVTKAFVPPVDIFPTLLPPGGAGTPSGETPPPASGPSSESGSTPNSPPPTTTNPTSTTPPSPPSGTSTPTQTDTNTTPTSSTSTTTLSPTSTPTSTPPSPTSTTTPPPENNPYIIYYYSPDGRVVGTSSAQITANFWAQHINRNIELGWHNLPPQTTSIKAFRSSQGENGPWEKLLEQSDIDPIGPMRIRLVDSSMDTPHWYKVEAWVDSTFIGTFGPVFLEAISIP